MYPVLAGQAMRPGLGQQPCILCDGVITILLWTLHQHYSHSGLMPGNEGDTSS